MKNHDFLDDIRTLNNAEKDAIRLRFCRDLSFSEMGKQLGITTRAAKLILIQALNKVRIATCPDPDLVA